MKTTIKKHAAICVATVFAILWSFQPICGHVNKAGPSSTQEKARQYLAKALTLVASIVDDSAKADALAAIALAQADAGDFSGALLTVTKIEKEVQDERRRKMRRASALRTIAGSQAKAGDVKGAVSTAEMLTDQAGGKDGFAFGVIAKAQAEAGDIAGATQTAESIKDQKSKEAALKWVAEAKSKSGRPVVPPKVEGSETENSVEARPIGYERCIGYVALAKAALVNSTDK